MESPVLPYSHRAARAAEPYGVQGQRGCGSLQCRAPCSAVQCVTRCGCRTAQVSQRALCNASCSTELHPTACRATRPATRSASCGPRRAPARSLLWERHRSAPSPAAPSPRSVTKSPAHVCSPRLRRATPSPTLSPRSDPNPDLPDQTPTLQVMFWDGSFIHHPDFEPPAGVPGTFSVTLRTAQLFSYLSPALPCPTGIMGKQAALHGFCCCWGKLETKYGHLSSATAGAFPPLVPFQACLSPGRWHSGTHIPAHRQRSDRRSHTDPTRK